MRQKLGRRMVPRYSDECDLKPGPASMLHGRDAVRIVGDQRKDVYRPSSGKSRHIEPDSHVNALLLESGFEIGIRERYGWRERDSRLLENKSAKLQHTCSHSE